MRQPRHATVVARRTADGWRGVLLTGPSGAGKSDLALRLIDAGWRLVVDDYAHVWASGEAVYAAAPETIAGRIEARGLGIVSAAWRPSVRIALVVDCVQAATERLPEPAVETVVGVDLPRLILDVRPASAATTLRLATDRL
jgi:serine kinase of HPr protein (carbohydrate metabolism regulator)